MKRVITSIVTAVFIATSVAMAVADGQPMPKLIGADEGNPGLSGQIPGMNSPLYAPYDKVAPVGGLIGPAFETSYPFGTTINLSGSFSDNGGTHTATWSFGNGETLAGVVDESTGTVTGSWQPTTPGYYFVTLTITDQAGNSVSLTTVVVVFDRGDGFLNGKGKFNSPAGAFVANPSLSGRVDFDFDTRYRQNDLAPSGTSSFKFAMNGMDFESASVDQDWFMVGFARGMYRGNGTINGTGNYKFLVSGLDGDDLTPIAVDKIRLKIVDAATGTLIYDNQMGAPDTAMATCPITGGGIEARLPNGGMGHLSAIAPRVESAGQGPARGFDLAQNFPNPFRASTQVRFSLPARSNVKLAVFDVAGREIASLANGAWDAGSHAVSWSGATASGSTARGGVYFVRLAVGAAGNQAGYVATRKMILQD
jgi:flagellar hook capping protein FlgD/PKD domain-containing protein